MLDKPFSAYKGNDAYVFVCYAHDDEDVVYPEMAWLHEQGINLWYDEGISGGKVWREEIGDAIKGASKVLYYISESSLASEHCDREINYALDHTSVLPVYLEEIELTTDLEVGLSRLQAIHRTTDGDYQGHLLRALGQTAEASRPLPRAKQRVRLQRDVLIALMVVLLIGVSGFGISWWYWQELPSSGDAKESTSIPAIAVLPFVNIGDTEDYFSDGITDEILNRMIPIREVRVISRNSSFLYKNSTLYITEIGKQLEADYILQGSVRKSGNLVRISVRLTDTTDGTEIWGSIYNRGLTDILRLQDEIAQVVLSEFLPNITVTLLDRPDVDPLAYDLYLKARQAVGAIDPISAKRLLQAAIAIDPNFAEAYGGLTFVYNTLRTHVDGVFAWGTQYDGDDELLRVLEKALELDSENISALVSEAELKFTFEFDLQGSISMLETLIKRFPNDVGVYYSYFSALRVAVKTDEALLVSARIQKLDPQSVRSAKWASMAYLAVGDFDRALRSLNRITPLDVEDACWSGRRCHLIMAQIYSGQLDAAEENMKLVKQEPDKQEPDKTYFPVWLAIERGQLDVARELYDSTPREIAAMAWHWLPRDIVLTGSTTRTLDAMENRTRAEFWISLLPHWDRWMSKHGSPVFKEAFAALRNEPRYQQALRKYGIDDDSLAKIQVHTDELWD